MTPAARTRALRAAAAVAALGACAPKPAPVAPAAPAEQPDDTPLFAHTTLDVDTCLEATARALEEERIDEELPCCRRLSEHFSELVQGDAGFPALQGWLTRDACCEAIGWGPGIACTPWGPPTPPSDTPAQARGPLDLRGVPTLAVCPPPDRLRAAAIDTWRARMLQEYGSADVFTALAQQLRDAGASPAAVAEIASFATEEHHHGRLCAAVVASLGGDPQGELPAAPPFPDHPHVGRLEAALRNLLSICCLSETVAVALIGAEREDMPPSPLRDLLTTLWADEVGHARTGWRLLEDLLAQGDPALPARLAAWLRTAFAHLEAHELSHLPLAATFGPEAAPWGLCDGAAARDLFFDTVREVIVPGLERLGIPAGPAWRARA